MTRIDLFAWISAKATIAARIRNYSARPRRRQAGAGRLPIYHMKAFQIRSDGGPEVPKLTGLPDPQALKITHRPQPKRRYFDVGLGAICLSSADTGGAYCLLDISLAPGIGVPRHTHTREDETYYVLSGELMVEVGDCSALQVLGASADFLVGPQPDNEAPCIIRGTLPPEAAGLNCAFLSLSRATPAEV
jgi:mannose-6-phosphate isomerase-like protein (cupin superfamily)